MANQTSLDSEMRRAIMSGEFAPASRLRMEELKGRFDVGFSPIREALSRLIGEGLVELVPNKGFRVSPLSKADLYDIAVARCGVEVAALRRSIAQGDDAWEAGIVAAMHQYRKKAINAFDTPENLAQWEAAHDRLHGALIAACGSARLIEFQRRLQDQHLRYRRLIVLPQVEHDPHEEEHERLVSAALERRADLAAQLIERHMMITVDALEAADFWASESV
jgi:DNA-binding GntR family transcriptional regulator